MLEFINEIIREIKGINSFKVRNQSQHEDKYFSLEIADAIRPEQVIKIEKLSDLHSIENKLVKVEPSNSSILTENIGLFLQQLPLVTQNESAKGVYRVVFPKGTIGNLMRYKNGTLGTPLVNGNKISGHAGLVPVSNARRIPLTVWSMISVVTGQYFLTSINSTLNRLFTVTEMIFNAIELEKESQIFSIHHSYKSIIDNYNYIFGNEGLRRTKLNTIDINNQELYKNIVYFQKSNNMLMKGIEQCKNYNDVVEKAKEVIGNNSKMRTNIYLYGIGKLLEVSLSESYDEDYCNYLKNEISGFADYYLDTLTNLEKVSVAKIDVINDKQGFLTKIFNDFFEYYPEIATKNNILEFINTDRKNMTDIKIDIEEKINGIIKLNSNDEEFIYIDKELYKIEEVSA